MPERFTKETRVLAVAAEAEARASGSPTIEAHHLLLALAHDPEGVAGDVLTASGLDGAAIQRAIHDEFEQTLGAVGVSLEALPQRRPPFPQRPRWIEADQGPRRFGPRRMRTSVRVHGEERRHDS